TGVDSLAQGHNGDLFISGQIYFENNYLWGFVSCQSVIFTHKGFVLKFSFDENCFALSFKTQIC
ncbi:MAG: hypothetical protein ACRCVE_13610, partial [Plesiomonas sp.]